MVGILIQVYAPESNHPQLQTTRALSTDNVGPRHISAHF